MANKLNIVRARKEFRTFGIRPLRIGTRALIEIRKGLKITYTIQRAAVKTVS
jgi:hypothetical protein